MERLRRARPPPITTVTMNVEDSVPSPLALLMWASIAIMMLGKGGSKMKIVQMTLDEDLVGAVDRAVQRLGTTRSAFARDALRDALLRLKERDAERRHREGYERQPVGPGEFSDWEDEQVWGD